MKMIGLARLGKDAEIRYTPAGLAVANLSLAVSYGKKQADGTRPTQWIDAAIWDKRAEALAPFMLKGSVHCFTIGDIHIEQFEGKNGTGYKLVGTVLDVELGPRADAHRPATAPSQHEQQKANGYAPAPAPASMAGDFDDSIPF